MQYLSLKHLWEAVRAEMTIGRWELSLLVWDCAITSPGPDVALCSSSAGLPSVKVCIFKYSLDFLQTVVNYFKYSDKFICFEDFICF